jgi:heat-inducible transcriptional repressor
VRSILARLEEQGLVRQPHTSAGRVPTDAAYRFYVDHLQRVPWVAGQAPAVGPPAVVPHAEAAERLMAETPGRLSSDTHMMGVLLAPPLKHTALDRIELVALDEERALAVLVTETGWVTARPLAAVPRGGADELREMGRALTRRFRGKTFQEILDELTRPADPLDPLWTRSRLVLDEVVAMLRDRTLYISGATNMLDHPDLSEPTTLRSMLRAFEDKARLVDLLSRMAEEQGLHVMIGGENPVEEMRGCSLITSTYSYRDQILGVLGVVGPRRMPYTEVMSIVDETARIVSISLSRVRQQLYLP